MSYARFGKNSAVYVYGSDCFGALGYVCCACRMKPSGEWFGNFFTHSLSTLKDHLVQHDNIGHRVPKHTWDRINDELAAKRVGEENV